MRPMVPAATGEVKPEKAMAVYGRAEERFAGLRSETPRQKEEALRPHACCKRAGFDAAILEPVSFSRIGQGVSLSGRQAWRPSPHPPLARMRGLRTMLEYTTVLQLANMEA